MAEPALRCWAEIDPRALRHNLAWVRSRLPGSGAGRATTVAVAAVLKADAYGHGLRTLAGLLKDEVEWFAVANLAEARAARAVASETPVLILGPALPGERPGVVAGGFAIVVSTAEEAAAYSRLAVEAGRTVELQLAVDTGMGRIGVWHEEAVALAGELARLSGVTLGGITTHLPSADCDEPWTEGEQLVAWHRLLDALEAAGLGHLPHHILNSAGAMLYGQREAGNLVRAGLLLYGSSPIPRFQAALKPVMTLKTAVTLVRTVPEGRGISYGRTFITPRAMRIATLAAGYGDGYPRHLSGGAGAEVLIGGRRCPILGRITMDQMMVDVSALPDVHAGEEVVLIGRQGSEEITAAELAEKAGTIAWEIFTGITQRVVRVILPE